MPDLNNMLKELSNLQEEAKKSVDSLSTAYLRIAADVNTRFHEEFLENNSSLTGLEDFYILNTTLKRNMMAVKNAMAVINRMKSLTGYDISEETIEQNKIEQILENK